MRHVIQALLLALLLSPGSLHAQDYEDEDGQGAYLSIRIEQNGRGTVTLTVPDLPAAADPGAVQNALTRALRDAVPCSLYNMRATQYRTMLTLWAECPALDIRQGPTSRIELAIAPLYDTLDSLGVRDISLSLSHPVLGFNRGPEGIPSHRYSGEINYIYRIDQQTDLSRPLVFEYGFYRHAALVIAAALLFFLLVPIILVLIARTRSLRFAQQDRDAAWFGFWKVSRRISDWSWIAWFGAAAALKLDRWLAFTLPGIGRALYPLALFLPMIVLCFVCHLLARPVWRAVRGIEWSRAEAFWQELFRQMATLWPIMLVFVGISSWPGAGHAVMGWIALALAVFAVGAWAYGKATNMRPHALLAGDLRLRINELATKAGVTLRHVFLMPAGKFQMGNAFASQGSTIILTDYLIGRLDRKETDCVVAHEIGHLKHKHTLWLSWGGFIAIYFLITMALKVLTGAMSMLAVVSLHSLPAAGFSGVGGLLDEYLSYPLALLLSLLALYFLARKFEHSADEYAVLLTNDPDHMITALVKLSRMNLMPLQWGRWDEGLSTHPSTLRRIRLIAARHGIGEARLAELLKTGDTMGQGYDIPAGLLDPGRVFTSQFRQGKSLLILLATVLNITLVPLALAGALQRLRAAWPLYLVGALLMPLLHLALANFASLWGYAGLKRRLLARLQKDGAAIDPGTMEFIGFAPEPRYRVYEGHTVWDVGFLRLGPSAMEYRGDQTSFAVPKAAITRITLETGFPSWYKVPDIFIHWNDQAGTSRIYRLHSLEGSTMLGIRNRTAQLYTRMDDWSKIRAMGEPAQPALPLPALDTVSGTAPRDTVKLAGVLASVVLITLIVWWGGAALGIHNGLLLMYANALSLMSLFTGFVPVWRYREPDPGGPEK